MEACALTVLNQRNAYYCI